MPPPPRPSWHLDLKWIFGLLVTALLFADLVLMSAIRITDEEPAVNAMTKALAVSFSPNGLDSETEFAMLKKIARLNPNGVTEPIPFLAMSVPNRDVLTLSARELRFAFFRQAAEPLYRSGPEGLAALASSDELKKSIFDGGGAFSIVTAKTHQWLADLFWPLLLATTVLCIPLILFSRRFGKLTSIGIVTLIASLPGYILLTILLMAATSHPPPPVPTANGAMDMAGFIGAIVLPDLVPIARQPFASAALFGGALLFISLCGTIGIGIVQRIRRKPAKKGE